MNSYLSRYIHLIIVRHYIDLLNTSNILKIIDNRSGETKDPPEEYIIKIYNKDHKLMLQMIQGE